MYSGVKYFKGLNALRFIAAYLVLIHHSEQIRLKYGLFNLKSYSIFNNGGLAVSFFFVLSGFLITFLLLKENNLTGKISIKKFYFKRVLRIWPLYFLLVIIGTVVLPICLDFVNTPYEMPYDFNDVILYYIFFSPFMVNIFFGHHLLEPLWSIGVEELFYLIWAPLFFFLKKHIVKLITGVIIIKVFLLLQANYMEVSSNYIEVLKMLKFESMAIGGAGAVFVFNRKKSIESGLLFSSISQYVMIIIILLRLFSYDVLTKNTLVFDYLFNTYILSDLLITTIFVWLIINVSLNPKSVIKLDSKVLNFLGEISYGIYMYHMLIVFTIILLLKNLLNSFNDSISTIIFYFVVTSLVICVSYLSKRFYEDKFLKFKPV